MSREVEVQNIQMTATVPEDIQISLGKLATLSSNEQTAQTDDKGVNLSDGTGVLYAAADGGASKGGATDPGDDVWNWASIADISKYYQLGKILPASSTTGEDIFFTPDASGVGKTLKSSPRYYQAADGLTANAEVAITGRTGTDGSLRTTLHAFKNTTEKSGGWTTGYQPSVGWDNTGDDGYYVDIPIWLRTSSSSGATLSVDAYVTALNAATDDDELYMAARVVVLKQTESTEGTPYGGVIELRQDSYSGNSVVDYMTTTNATNEAVASISSGTTGVYGAVTRYTGNISSVTANAINLVAPDGSANYGAATKVWVRVWLEGEDPNCWNSNAGQDFSINLKFTNGDTTSATAVTYGATGAEMTALKKGDTVKVTLPENANMGTVDSGTTRVLTYTYDGSTWVRTAGTFYGPSTGKKYQISSSDITGSNEAGLVTYITSTVTTKALATTNTTTPIIVNEVDAT